LHDVKRMTPRVIFRQFTAAGMIGLLLVVLLPSCTLDPDLPFRVGTNIWPGYEPLYLAREMGHLNENRIKLVELPNATEVIQALRNEVLEAAALTLDEALSVVQDGYDLKVVLIMDFSRGGDALLAHPTIHRLADLRGKRIGVESTAVGALLLDAALRKVSLSLEDVTLVPLTVDRHLEAYKQHRIDALVTFEPMSSKILAQGAKSLFDSAHIPNRIIDVLVVRSDIAKHREDTLRYLLEGYFKALEYQHNNPLEAAQHMMPRLNLSGSELLNALDGLHQPDLEENRALLIGNERQTLTDSLQHLIRLMLDQNLLHSKPVTSNLLSGQWLPKAQ